MPNTKFVARYNGQIVGKRTSPRPYAFAIVVQYDIEVARARAYGYTLTDSDRKNYDWYAFKAAQTPGAEVVPPRWNHSYKFTAEEIGAAQAKVDGGLAAFEFRCRQEAIRYFEERVAAGGFEPMVTAWSMSRANAEKAARQWPTIAIVPAEVA